MLTNSRHAARTSRECYAPHHVAPLDIIDVQKALHLLDGVTVNGGRPSPSATARSHSPQRIASARLGNIVGLWLAGRALRVAILPFADRLDLEQADARDARREAGRRDARGGQNQTVWRPTEPRGIRRVRLRWEWDPGEPPPIRETMCVTTMRCGHFSEKGSGTSPRSCDRQLGCLQSSDQRSPCTFGWHLAREAPLSPNAHSPPTVGLRRSSQAEVNSGTAFGQVRFKPDALSNPVGRTDWRTRTGRSRVLSACAQKTPLVW